MQSTQYERTVRKKQNLIKKYDFQKCKIHRRATSFGQPIGQQIVCQCCFRNASKKQIGCNFSIQELFYLGPQMPEYFINLKVSISIIIILLCVYGIPMTIINYINNDCQKYISLDCSSLFFVNFSFVNSSNSELNLLIQTILASIGVILSLIAKLMGKNVIQRMKFKCKQKYCFQNDYSVFIRFQHNQLNQQYIQQSLQDWWKNQKLQNKNLKSILRYFYPDFNDQKINQLLQYRQKGQALKSQELQKLLWFLDRSLIKKIIFSYNIQKFSEIKQKIQNLEKITKKIEEVSNHRQLKQKQIQTLKIILEQLSILQSQKNLSRYLELTNKCILIFQFQPISEYFIQKFNFSFCEFKQKIQSLNIKTIERAPTPKQINWENHHLLLNEHKFKPRICSILTFLILILMASGIITGLLIYEQKQLHNKSTILQYIFAPLLAIIIIILNFFVRYIITWSTGIEKRPFRSQMYKSMFKQQLFFQFLTQGLILGIIYCLIGIQFIWAKNGFLDTLFYLYMFHLILHPLAKFINFGILTQLISYHMIEQNSNSEMSQQQANQAYQKKQFQLASSSSWVMLMLILSSFVSGLAPFSLVLCLICLVIEYFTQKLYLINFCKQSVCVSEQFNYYIYKIINLSPILVNFGNLWCIILRISNDSDLNKYSAVLIINLTVLLISVLIIFLLGQKKLFIFDKCIMSTTQKAKEKYISNDQDQISSYRSNQFKLLLKNQKNQQVKAKKFQLQQQTSNLYEKCYDSVSKKFIQKYQKVYPIPNQYLLKLGSKQISATYRQKMQIIQELNTMSKTLQQSLKDRLFSQNRKTAILTQTMTHRQVQDVDDNIYFQYQKKITMDKPSLRVKIPPLYKKVQEAPGSKNLSSMEYQVFKSKQAISIQSSSKRQQQIEAFQLQNQSQQLKKMSTLFGEDEEQLKNIVKNKIKQSIQKVNNK